MTPFSAPARAAALLGFLACAGGLSASSRAPELRAVWITRFDYRTEEDVRAVLSNSASLGFNTVFLQVRGQADAYYRSSLEPWSERLGGRDPGFDPLETACREARRLGLQLHAWINVMPAWKGRTPPASPRHLLHRRPDWIVAGRDGRRQRLNDHYVILNPCLPAVRDHLVAIAREIAARYPVDGLHLDYVRFLEGDWSYDDATLGLFRRASGGAPADRPQAWAEFRRGAVTDLVRGIRHAIRDARPAARLSAAVFPSAKSRAALHQDAEGWVREGLVDAVFPMAYTDDDGEFARQVDECARVFRAGSAAVSFPGIGAYKHEVAEQTARQARMCPDGFGVFAYSSLFATADDAQRDPERLRRARREALRIVLRD